MNVSRLTASFVFALLGGLSAACSHAVQGTPLAELQSPDGLFRFVIADPQIHNVFGNRLKQMSVGADIVARVAIRPPELNLLAGHSLEYLPGQGAANAPKGETTIVLGDASNIAWTLLRRDDDKATIEAAQT